jgi:integrase
MISARSTAMLAVSHWEMVMDGSLRQRGPSSWELRVYDGTHPDSGKDRYATRTVRGSRRDATAELEVFAAQVAKPRRRALDSTFGELFKQWYGSAAPRWALNTRRQPRSVIDVHLIPRFGHLAVGDLTTEAIDVFYADLRCRGGHDGAGLSDGTVHRIHGVLSRALSQAVRWAWVWTNPARHACPPVAHRREIFSPPPAAVARLLAATYDTPGLHAFFRLAVSTGARRGQLCALRWSDVDLERNTVSFARSLAEGPEGGVQIVATKNHKRNRVEVDDATIAQVRRHRVDVDQRAADAGVDLLNDAYVFAREADGASPWRPNWVTTTFIAPRDGNGLAGYRLHDYAISWPPRCSLRAYPYRSCRRGSRTTGSPPPSTFTPTR